MKNKIAVFIILFMIGKIMCAQLHVSPYFKDHIVLQRNCENKIWGTAQGKETIKIEIEGKIIKTKANKKGKWQISIPEFKEGGPYTINIQSETNEIVVRDVLFGDVWLCSGQSNMEYAVKAFSWSETEMKQATNNQIRFFEVPNRFDEIPVEELPENVEWKLATGNSLGNLSAVAYWFSKNVQTESGVPIGLITADWSGTALEPWMPMESLQEFSQFDEVIEYLKKDPKSHKQIDKEFQEYLTSEWGPKYYYKGIGLDEKWYTEETDYSQWDTINLPCWWENAGIGLEDYDGSIWFRTSFDLPEGFQESEFLIDLNLIKDYDMLWINGVKIGETYGDQNWRHYWAKRSILKEKNNSLVIRVFNLKGYGGMNFHPLWATPILKGDWLYRKGRNIKGESIPEPRIVNKSPFAYPGAIYNAMIYPLINMQIKGAIWYQGESNAGRAKEYADLFPAMLKGWRKAFDQGNFPFYFVQLANFGKEAKFPEENDWAEIRESQKALLQLPNTGMAVTIDVGEENNIHPANKMEVGKRLALHALKNEYGKNVIANAPEFKKMSIVGDSIVVEIETFGSQLHCTDKYGYVKGFAIAAANEDFVWAKAILRNNKILVYSNKVKNPKHIRYAWSKNPGKLNLYNTNNLPLCPFRTDDRKGITDGRVFSLQTVYF